MTRRTKPNQSATQRARKLTGNLRDLAIHLGISIPTLQREISTDPSFPIRSRGGRGVAWDFDFVAVAAHRQQKLIGKGAISRKPTIAERRAEAQASLAEIELAEAQGRLVEREEVMAVLSGAYVKLGKFLDRFAKATGAELGWSAETIATVRGRLDDGRCQFVKDVAEFGGAIEPENEEAA